MLYFAPMVNTTENATRRQEYARTSMPGGHDQIFRMCHVSLGWCSSNFGVTLKKFSPGMTHVMLTSNMWLVLFSLLFGQFCRLEKGRILYDLVKNILYSYILIDIKDFPKLQRKKLIKQKECIQKQLR